MEKKEVYFIEDNKVKKGTIEKRDVLIYRGEIKNKSYTENEEEEKKFLKKQLKWKLSDEKRELINLEKRQYTEFGKKNKEVNKLTEMINLL